MSLCRKCEPGLNKRLPFLRLNILKISSQYSTYIAKETPFRSEIMRYNDLEQTNTLFLRENSYQNASNFANVFAYMSPESIDPSTVFAAILTGGQTKPGCYATRHIFPFKIGRGSLPSNSYSLLL